MYIVWIFDIPIVILYIYVYIRYTKEKSFDEISLSLINFVAKLGDGTPGDW